MVECSVSVLVSLLLAAFCLGFVIGAIATDSGNPHLQILVDKVRLHTTRAHAAADLEGVATSLGLPPGTVAPVGSLIPLMSGILVALQTVRGQVRAA